MLVRKSGRPGSLDDLDQALPACRRCDLWRHATQAVAGEGPAGAAIMLVGEQPGDAEDLTGRPFVGPAGRVLDKALREAGLERERIFVTNAVKHFKFEQRGKRRLHKRPDAGEISACRFWLEQEREAVAARVIVAMGASAASAVLGRSVPVLASRGRAFELAAGAKALVTIHPSYLLRLRDERDKARELAGFVADLARAGDLAAA
jgi:DNA polymerase